MIERKLLNDNVVKVIGTLTDVEVNAGTTHDGRDYISGKLTVKVNEKSLELHFFSMKMTKAGAVNKLYNTYSTLDTLRGRRVEITGDIDESKIVSGTEIRRGNTLNAKFINLVKDTDERPDEATFSVCGFVNSGLQAVYGPDGATLKDYNIQIGQANYNNSFAKLLRFNADPSNINVVQGIQNSFTPGSTVKVEGVLDFSVETSVQNIENDFGPSTQKTTQRSLRRYIITSGKKIIDDFAYTTEEINELVLGAQEDDKVQIAKRGSNLAAASNAQTTVQRTASQPKLI